MKKKKTTIISILALFIILCLPYWINDFSCFVYKNSIEKSLVNIPEIKVLQIVNGCGNSGGTGNHTDLYVAALVETDSDIEEIKKQDAPGQMDR